LPDTTFRITRTSLVDELNASALTITPPSKELVTLLSLKRTSVTLEPGRSAATTMPPTSGPFCPICEGEDCVPLILLPAISRFDRLPPRF
jgi:hypothetical protein